MKGVFEGFALVSDIDGTLVDNHKQIPQRNREAIARFMDLGGRFTVATGRCPASARFVAEELHINCPAVTHNGAMLADPMDDTVFWESVLPHGYDRVAEQMLEGFPEVGAQLFIGSRIVTVRPNSVTDYLLRTEKMPQVLMGEGEYPRNVNKILFGGTPEQLEKVRSCFEAMDIPAAKEMYGMFTEKFYYEILPQGVTKGSGMLKMASMCGIPADHIVAIGDYYNDIALLEAAALPILSGSAPRDMYRFARHVTCPCDDGAVAEAIDYLENQIRAEAFPGKSKEMSL